MDNLKIYLCGAITDNQNANDDFTAAELEVHSLYPDAIVYNPIRQSKLFRQWNLNHSQMMLISMAFLDHADIIYMLRNWKNSRGGAHEEFARAKARNIKVIYQESE